MDQLDQSAKSLGEDLVLHHEKPREKSLESVESASLSDAASKADVETRVLEKAPADLEPKSNSLLGAAAISEPSQKHESAQTQAFEDSHSMNEVAKSNLPPESAQSLNEKPTDQLDTHHETGGPAGERPHENGPDMVPFEIQIPSRGRSSDKAALAHPVVQPETTRPSIAANEATKLDEYGDVNELIALFQADQRENNIQENIFNMKYDADGTESEDSEAAAAAFQSRKRQYEREKRQGKLTPTDEIEYVRLEMQEHERQRRSQQKKAADDQEALESLPLPAEDELFLAEDSTQRECAPASQGPSLKRRAVYNDADPGFNETESDSEEHLPKKKRPRKTKELQNQPQGKQAKNSKGKSKPRKKTKAQIAEEQQQANLLNHNTLAGSSVFHAAQTNRARADQPKLNSTRRNEAFKHLIASIPEEERNVARTDRKQLETALKNIPGRHSCRTDPATGLWELSGLTSRLEHYQMLGVSFMRKRELGEEAPLGGLLADDMGLGKTVSCIANMVNDALHNKSLRKTTLIVVPSSITHQWMQEIGKHGGDTLKRVVRYDARVDSNDPVEFLTGFDVVVATYAQVLRSYPKKEPPVALQTVEAKKAWWIKHFRDNKGPLHSVVWRRVVLDEATAIKNYQSLTSAATNELQADFRWAVTGTPAMNSLQEFYSYFRFLKAPNTGSFRVFKKNFITDGPGNERLIAFLRPFMLRRTHQDSMFGAKLLNLPPPHRNTMMLHFKSFERDLYKIVHDRFVHRINGIAARGELEKSYSNVLVLLLRLRQLAGHPLMIQDTMRDLLEPEDFVKIDKVLTNHLTNMPRYHEQESIIITLRKMLRDPKNLRQLERLTPESSQHSSQQPQNVAEPVSIGGAFGIRDDFAKFIKELKESKNWGEFKNRVACARCKKLPKDPHFVSCQHTYCWECLVLMENEAGDKGQEQAQCVACGEFYTGKEPYSLRDIDSCVIPGEIAADASGNKRKATSKSNAQQAISQWIDASGNMLPSAKTLAFKSQVMNYVEKDRTVKIIVYTQFMTMVHILTKICQIEGWACLQFHGGMSQKARKDSLERFNSDPDKNVLIATLRTGGMGLNLVVATRVIIMDPWWNFATEEQAFCRTYRRGQLRETEMVRLMVEGTIDTQIQAMQERKEFKIGMVMSETGRNVRLPIPTLLRLFGPVEEDDQGNQFIYVDDKQGELGPARVVHEGEDDEMEMGDSQ